MPEPPLFPDEDRVTIEGAEAWADSVLQDGVRQLARYGIGKDKEAMATFLAGPLLGIPRARRPACDPGAASRRARCRCAPPTRPRKACLEALPGQLDRVDALLAEGVIGGERPNAADFQIAPIRAADAVLRPTAPARRGRPAGRHARARPRLSRAGSRKCFPPHGFRSETRRHLRRRDRGVALAPRGSDGCRRARPRPVGRARPAPARLRRALRRGRPRRARCSTIATSAPAAASRASCWTSTASSRTGAARSRTRAGWTGSRRSACSAPRFGGGHAIEIAATSRGRAPSSPSAR